MKVVVTIVVFVSLIISLQASVYALTFTKNLSIGAKGNEVMMLQQFLISKGFLSGTATGYFGAQTKKAIQDFQKSGGLPATGNWLALTRQKAESLLSTSSPVVITASSAPISDIKKSSIASSAGKDIKLTVSTNTGGYITMPNGKTCYSNETCYATVPAGTKINLKAYTLSGYNLKKWSEANCGNSLECSFTTSEDTVVNSYFAINEPEKGRGYIVSPKKPSEVCYIPLGWDKCNFRFTWLTNTAYKLAIKLDGTKYILRPADENDIFNGLKLDPADILKSEEENVSGPVYFDIFFGLHKFILEAADQEIDSSKVEAKCLPGHYWDGNKCWEKGAQLVYVFKHQGIIVKSEPAGINCGYHPEACFAGFSGGSTVTLKAILAPGYTFPGWNGDCSGKDPVCVLKIDGVKKVGIQDR